MSDVKRFRVCDPLNNGAHLVDDANGEAVLFTDYEALDAKCKELQERLDKIEKQRARWRVAKSKSRRIQANPQRYDPAQASIYGDGHVAELTS
jgi:hypothetical protein